MYALLFVLFSGFLDAMIKGTIMARKKWKNIPDFFHNSGPYPWVLFASAGIVGVMFSFANWDGWIDRIFFYIESLLFGLVGGESLFYWWWLKPLNIKQHAHWKPNSPAVSWFEYPETAPWLDGMILPKIFSGGETTTRKGVYTGCGFVFIAIVLGEIIRFGI